VVLVDVPLGVEVAVGDVGVVVVDGVVLVDIPLSVEGVGAVVGDLVPPMQVATVDDGAAAWRRCRTPGGEGATPILVDKTMGTRVQVPFGPPPLDQDLACI